jgi:hypothetical protein
MLRHVIRTIGMYIAVYAEGMVEVEKYSPIYLTTLEVGPWQNL